MTMQFIFIIFLTPDISRNKSLFLLDSLIFCTYIYLKMERIGRKQRCYGYWSGEWHVNFQYFPYFVLQHQRYLYKQCISFRPHSFFWIRKIISDNTFKNSVVPHFQFPRYPAKVSFWKMEKLTSFLNGKGILYILRGQIVTGLDFCQLKSSVDGCLKPEIEGEIASCNGNHLSKFQISEVHKKDDFSSKNNRLRIKWKQIKFSNNHIWTLSIYIFPFLE